MNERQNNILLPDVDDAECNSLSVRFKFEAVVDILQTRFSDYSNDAPILTTISPALDLETLRQIFNIACRASSFKEFCDELDAFWTSREAQTDVINEERQNELVTAQIFNNFVVKILEQRRRIGASFLRRYFDEISPKVAQELDFDAYATEPTVHIFGAQVSRLCDLIFSIPFKDRSKGAQTVVVPMEHKSTPTRNVVFQLLTSLVLVLQYILQHKERFQRSDKKFVWPFLLLFYTGARPWKKVLNFPGLFATPYRELDRYWIFKLPFKFVSLFAPSKRPVEPDPWLDAFLELTKAAEKIVAKKDATSEDWKQAWNGAFKILEGKLGADDEEGIEIFDDFVVFVTKVSAKRGWDEPTREEITQKLEETGDATMTNKIYNINSIHELLELRAEQRGEQKGEQRGEQRGEQKGEQKGIRSMLKICLDARFPQISQTTLNAILSITNANILESIFKVACTSDSLDHFQRDIRGLAPTI